jgi:hypothetical protein
MTTTTRTGNEIKAACIKFLKSWDDQAWMEYHGEWASSAWTSEREAYDVASARVQDALADSESVDVDDLMEAMDELREAAEALRDQVRPDESDYIATNPIDPDSVRSSAQCLGIGEASQRWDCVEGWGAYRSDDALIVRWYRHAYGSRHDLDLWVVVDEEFFPEPTEGETK